MFQRNSFCWQLSELSPVWIANASGVPLTGAGLHVVDRPDHRLGDLEGEHLLRAIARREEPDDGVAGGVLVLEPVDVLQAHRRLRVDQVHVGHVGEGEHRRAGRRTCGVGGAAEVSAHDVRLAGLHDDGGVAAGAGGAAHERLRERRVLRVSCPVTAQAAERERHVSQRRRPADHDTGLDEGATRQDHAPTTITRCDVLTGHIAAVRARQAAPDQGR